VLDDVGEAPGPVAVLAAAADLLEVHQRDPAYLVHQLMELVDLEPERVRHLFLGRRAAEPLLDLAVGALQAPALLADAARHPVERAELVEDRTLDAELGIGLELAVLVGVVLLD